MLKKLIFSLAVLFGLVPAAFAQQYTDKGAALSSVAGVKVAQNYAFTPARIYAGPISAASPATFQITNAQVKLPDGRTIVPFFVGEVVQIGQGSTQESVTLTAVNGCYNGAPQGSCTISGNTSNAHGQGDLVASGTLGVGEAVYDAFSQGGGQVVVDGVWKALGGVDSYISSATVFPNVGVIDNRGPATVYWNPIPNATLFAAPSALASGTVASSATVAGSASYTGGTIHVCYTAVDIMGNEGPCSADYSFADTSAKAIVFTAPPATTGAVGWRPYIGVESGSANNEYLMPLVTQPSAIGAYPASNGVCTLTTLETFTPACAITNATYGQVGSGATVTAYPVVTSQQSFQLGGVSTTSFYAPNSNARTIYTYTPGAHPGVNGIVSSAPAYTVSAALASTVPFVLGTVNLPVGFMNYVGREIRVCGFVTDAAGTAATITSFQFWWDAQGSNVTSGIPVLLGGPKITVTNTAAATNWQFCQDIRTTVASASATGGTLQALQGWASGAQTAAGTVSSMATNLTAAAVGSLNLAEDARIDIVYVETTGTTATPKLQNVTVQVLN